MKLTYGRLILVIGTAVFLTACAVSLIVYVKWPYAPEGSSAGISIRNWDFKLSNPELGIGNVTAGVHGWESFPSGKSGKATFAGQDYDLAQGTLFLISTKGPTVRVLQLKRDLLNVHLDDVEELICNDKDIRLFFANTVTPEKIPEQRLDSDG